MAILAFSGASQAQPSSTVVTGTYHFTTPQTAKGLQEAATIVRTVASAPQASVDASTATLTFSGSAESVAFAAWLLPRIDRAAGDDAVYQYGLPSGDIGRIKFVPNVQTGQEMQELLTILRVVADVQKIFTFSSNHAMVLSGRDWQAAFSEWIIDQIDQPREPKPDPTPREFTVGGPDYRGLGHGARLNFLANVTGQRETQQVLTVLRTVGDLQKVFNYTSSHALIFRAGDTDLERAEWMIQNLDLPAGQSLRGAVFTAPADDDVTRIFHVLNANPEWLATAVTGLRSELKIRQVFYTTAPATIVVRGTKGQMAEAVKWMAAQNALFE
jgi:hypothetical protein